MKFFIVFFLFLFSYQVAITQTPDATAIRQLMERRDRQIKTLLGPSGSTYTESQREQLKEIINGIMDYDAMARIALQESYTAATPAQRTEFVKLFSQVIRDQSLAKLDVYRAQVVYEKITSDGQKAKVETTAILNNVRTPVWYALEKRGTGWVITDMAVDNVSTAESYRRSFQNVIRRRGFDGLLENLRRRAGA
jgi:phospholipid transport system substrate-binding protein